MFGRFGGGGNFVAQYRCYPVSFIDRVRAPPWPSARDALKTPPLRMPPRALTLAPTADHAPRLSHSRNLRMAIKVRLDPRKHPEPLFRRRDDTPRPGAATAPGRDLAGPSGEPCPRSAILSSTPPRV